MATITSTEERLERLEEKAEETLQLLERLIDHVLPKPEFTNAHRSENALMLTAWPERWPVKKYGDDA